MYKYRIHYLLRQLTVNDYEISWIFFPQALNISKSTWKQWIYIKNEDNREIPQEALKKIATFFEVPIDEMFSSFANCSLKEMFEKFKA